MRALIVDGNSILNRAFYGIRPLTNSSGVRTEAVYGFFSSLYSQIDQINPTHIAVAFDLPAKTFRHKLYDGYKASRKRMPEELAAQLPIVKGLLKAQNIAVFEVAGYEADDIIGTFANACERSGVDCYILTGDRDSLQLVTDKTSVLLSGNKEVTLYTPRVFREKYEVEPPRLVDMKALMGDSSDEIPGVRGIGEKTAQTLIREYGSLDGLYAALDGGSLKTTPAVLQRLTDGRESAYMSYKLAEICKETPINKGLSTEESIASTEKKPPNESDLFEVLTSLELGRFIKRFFPNGHIQNDTPLNIEAVAADKKTAAEEPKAEAVELTPDRLFEGITSKEVALSVETVGEDSLRVELFDGVQTKTAAVCRADGAEFAEKISAVVSRGTKIIAWNAKKTLHLLGADADTRPLFCDDIKIAAYLLSPSDNGYTPEGLANAYKVTGGSCAECLYKLAPILRSRLIEFGLMNLYRDVEMPLLYTLYRMETEGFAVDVTGLKTYGERLSAEAQSLSESIYKHAGMPFNVNSPKQLGTVLFDKLKLPYPKNVASEATRSTSAEVLEALLAVHPIIAEIMEYRHITKLASTYAAGLSNAAGKDGRIHTEFNQTVAATGRLSSTEPNLQNIPVRTPRGREFRKFFVPRPGYALVDADYSQIELRVLAALSGDPQMIGAFESGGDIHRITASEVFGVPPSQVTQEMRSRAKAVNFGIVYGIGAHSLAQDLGIPYGAAADYIEAYFRVYPTVKTYLNELRAAAAERGYAVTAFGRRRYIPELNSAKRATKSFGERVAMNSPIQGTAADIIKIAMVKTDDRLRRELPRAKLILQIHDELIIECPVEIAKDAARILREEMESAADLNVKMIAEAKILPHNWGEK